jgi:sRNA-binding protein
MTPQGSTPSPALAAPEPLHGPFAGLPRSKAQAKAEGSRLYFPALRCLAGHTAPRNTYGSGCQACTVLAQHKANKERYRATKKAAALAAKAAAQDAAREARRAAAEERKAARAAQKAADTRAKNRAAKAAAAPQAVPVTYPLPEAFQVTAGPADALAAPWE